MKNTSQLLSYGRWQIFLTAIYACVLVAAGSADAKVPSILGKWKSVIVEGKPVTNEFSYWEFFENGTLESVKWDGGRIEQSATFKWRQIEKSDTTFLVIEVSGRQAQIPIFLYADSLITIDQTRLDRPYKGRAIWHRVDSLASRQASAEPSKDTGPKDEEIISAAHKALTKKVPGLLVRYATGGENAQIIDLRITSRGRYQQEGNTTYWPVKLFAKGTCYVLFGDKKSFEGDIEYFIFQDPYGQWKAEYRGL